VELLGGQALTRVRELDVSALRLGRLVNVLVLLLQPAPRAPWSWRRRARVEGQAQLTLGHRRQIVQTLEELEAAGARAPAPAAVVAEAVTVDALPPHQLA